jgi:hypothetical protein
MTAAIKVCLERTEIVGFEIAIQVLRENLASRMAARQRPPVQALHHASNPSLVCVPQSS